MHDAQRLVALVHRFKDDAETVNVGKLLEADRLALHFAPDRIGALAPSVHLGAQEPTFGQLPGELVFNFADQILIAFGKRQQALGHDLIGFRIDLPE